ncbi:hypothetical protein GCM10027280_37430 [Micromonospora polyrhachis]|uniref:Uncharacterized protein n=2 Tax=Micromonospora polyrhachis TaxID=1282883 RepID=A0A7W7SWL8_9ACTN|nr:hypothetical protein [Micromonospora polyrhachis]
MYAGLALTAITTLVPLIDLVTADTLTNHVRAAYPEWPAATVALDRNAIVGYLVAVGVLGIAGWLWTIRGVTRHRNWARTVATIMFVLGVSAALLNLTFTGGAYDNVIPAQYSIPGLLPSLVGLVLVVLLWRGRSTDSNSTPR